MRISKHIKQYHKYYLLAGPQFYSLVCKHVKHRFTIFDKQSLSVVTGEQLEDTLMSDRVHTWY